MYSGNSGAARPACTLFNHPATVHWWRVIAKLLVASTPLCYTPCIIECKFVVRFAMKQRTMRHPGLFGTYSFSFQTLSALIRPLLGNPMQVDPARRAHQCKAIPMSKHLIRLSRWLCVSAVLVGCTAPQAGMPPMPMRPGASSSGPVPPANHFSTAMPKPTVGPRPTATPAPTVSRFECSGWP